MFSNHLLFNLKSSKWCFSITHQIPYFDSLFSRGSNPLELRIESQLWHLSIIIKLSSEFSHWSDIPNLNILSSSSSSQILSIGWNRHTVDILIMMFETTSDLEIGIPDLDSTIPTHWTEVWTVSCFLVLQDWWISNTTDPILMVWIITSEFVLSSSIP